MEVPSPASKCVPDCFSGPKELKIELLNLTAYTAEQSCLQRLEWTSRPAESTMACMLLACKTSNCTIVKPPQPFCDIMGPYGQLTQQTPSLGFESSTVIFILMSVHVIWEVELNSSLHY